MIKNLYIVLLWLLPIISNAQTDYWAKTLRFQTGIDTTSVLQQTGKLFFNSTSNKLRLMIGSNKHTLITNEYLQLALSDKARLSGSNTFVGVQSMTSPSISTSITTPSTSFDLLNTTALTVNAFSQATTLTIGNPNATHTHNYSSSGIASGIKTVNVATTGGSGLTVLNLATTGGGATMNVNIGGGASGTTTINSPNITAIGTISANSGTITTTQPSFNLINTTATTGSLFGAATNLTIGGTPTGTITHNYSTNATASGQTKTVNLGTGGSAGSTTNVNIGDADGGTTTINSPTLNIGTIASGAWQGSVIGSNYGGAGTVNGLLKANGSGVVSAAVAGTDYLAPGGGAALTKADDTNVTLTLGGSPSTALLNAASITAGWTGQLAESRGGTGSTVGAWLKSGSTTLSGATSINRSTANTLDFNVDDASNGTTLNVASFNRTTSGTAGSGIASSISLGVENNSGIVKEGYITHRLQSTTNGAENSGFRFSNWVSGTLTENIYLGQNPGARIGLQVLNTSTPYITLTDNVAATDYYIRNVSGSRAEYSISAGYHRFMNAGGEVGRIGDTNGTSFGVFKIGTSGSMTGSPLFGVVGTGTTTGVMIQFQDNSGTQRFRMLDNGTLSGTFIVPIANGGTNASTAAAARVNLLPSLTGNTGKYLKVNAGETDVEWVTITGGGDMLAANNLSDVANVTTARNNILPNKTGNSLKLLRVNAGETDYELTQVLPIANGGTNNSGLSVSNGTIYYGDGTKIVGLAPGVAGQVLQTNGAAAPSWLTLGAGSGDMILASPQTNTGAKTFNNNTFIHAGSTSGTVTVNAPAVAGTQTINWPAYSGEADVFKKIILGSDYTNNSTTASEITGLQITSTGIGLFEFEYNCFVQSAATTTGWKFGVNHTGTATVLSIQMTYGSTGGTAATGVGDDVAAVNTGNIYEHSVATSFSTAGNLGPTAGVAVINTNVWVKVRGVISVTVSGDLELYAGSEVATSQITVKQNSFGRLWLVN